MEVQEALEKGLGSARPSRSRDIIPSAALEQSGRVRKVTCAIPP